MEEEKKETTQEETQEETLQSPKEETKTTPAGTAEERKPSRAERRIQQLIAKNKTLEEKNVSLVEAENKRMREASGDELTPRDDLASRIERLETSGKENELLADVNDQLKVFQSEQKLSDGAMKRINRIVRAEGLVDSETNDVDTAEALRIYQGEQKADKTEWESQKGEETTLAGKPAGGKPVTKPAKPPTEMSDAEVRQKGAEMLPDNF